MRKGREWTNKSFLALTTRQTFKILLQLGLCSLNSLPPCLLREGILVIIIRKTCQLVTPREVWLTISLSLSLCTSLLLFRLSIKYSVLNSKAFFWEFLFKPPFLLQGYSIKWEGRCEKKLGSTIITRRNRGGSVKQKKKQSTPALIRDVGDFAMLSPPHSRGRKVFAKINDDSHECFFQRAKDKKKPKQVNKRDKKTKQEVNRS